MTEEVADRINAAEQTAREAESAKIFEALKNPA
jgi:hypothetical protein